MWKKKTARTWDHTGHSRWEYTPNISWHHLDHAPFRQALLKYPSAVAVVFVIVIIFLLIITFVIIIVIITTPAVLELASSQSQLYVMRAQNPSGEIQDFFSLACLHYNHTIHGPHNPAIYRIIYLHGIHGLRRWCPVASHLHRRSTLGSFDRSVGDFGASKQKIQSVDCLFIFLFVIYLFVITFEF